MPRNFKSAATLTAVMLSIIVSDAQAAELRSMSKAGHTATAPAREFRNHADQAQGRNPKPMTPEVYAAMCASVGGGAVQTPEGRSCRSADDTPLPVPYPLPTD